AEHAARAAALASDRVVVPALLARGWVAHHAGDRVTAAEMATDAAKQARAERDPAGLAESLELRAVGEPDPAKARAALREALSVWTRAEAGVEAARIRHRLGHLTGAGVDDRLGALEAAETLARAGIAVESADATAVMVRAFGRFEVWLDGQPVPPARWQSRRARDLVRILIARRGRPVPRDELCEMLWPGEEPSGHRLSVLLSIIRRVLDPERALAQDHYIVADQASIGLDVGRLRVDVEEFLADLAHARRLRERGALDEAERLLSACLERYRADVFEDEPYEEWSVALREEARGGYVSTLRMLAQICRRRGRAGAAVGHLLRLLSVDPYDEAGHRALIEALVAGGQHGEAKRARERYLEAMRAIGIKPAA
ncbi:AfsR/SARP family transcriptional regulator, partial [Allorhizocola rhizosphaerae]|uniref:AfsR/SARP family transcriptional regulator n=1 Tax=Allorhizocola rhizosphaerae TaxID=1872709 RepID=UPI0014793CDA